MIQMRATALRFRNNSTVEVAGSVIQGNRDVPGRQHSAVGRSAARVPMPTQEELRRLQRVNAEADARAWDGLRDIAGIFPSVVVSSPTAPEAQGSFCERSPARRVGACVTRTMWSAKRSSPRRLASVPDAYRWRPPDERGGNGYVRPTETASHLDSTMIHNCRSSRRFPPHPKSRRSTVARRETLKTPPGRAALSPRLAGVSRRADHLLRLQLTGAANLCPGMQRDSFRRSCTYINPCAFAWAPPAQS
jgi:hypothetical protein